MNSYSLRMFIKWATNNSSTVFTSYNRIWILQPEFSWQILRWKNFSTRFSTEIDYLHRTKSSKCKVASIHFHAIPLLSFMYPTTTVGILGAVCYLHVKIMMRICVWFGKWVCVKSGIFLRLKWKKEREIFLRNKTWRKLRSRNESNVEKSKKKQRKNI